MLGRISVDIIGWFFTECCCLDTNVIKTFSGTARLICIDHDTENTVMMDSQWHCRHEGQAQLHAVIMVPWLVVLIKQGSDGLRTDCNQFWTHFCHIVLKVMILMVVSSTTTLFSFLLVDICFLSDLVMHSWSKIIMSIKKLANIFQTYFFYNWDYINPDPCLHRRTCVSAPP